MRKTRKSGQNLVELALTFPLLLVLILAVVEVGRAWNTYESARMAAMDGSYTAAIYQNTGLGEVQIKNRLDAANIPYNAGDIRVTQTNPNSGVYSASIIVQFRPIFSDLSINFMDQQFSLLPANIDISYQNVETNLIY
jgi:Flp pilus assembly protein TadG